MYNTVIQIKQTYVTQVYYGVISCLLTETCELSESEIFRSNHINVEILPFVGGESGANVRDNDDETFHSDCWTIRWRQDSCHPDTCQSANITRAYRQVVRSES
jgi:hypothetical protein